MSMLIEDMARALAAWDHSESKVQREWPLSDADAYRSRARAALSAAREPTPDQAFAGGGVATAELRMRRGSGEIVIGMSTAALVWRSMIDEALR